MPEFARNRHSGPFAAAFDKMIELEVPESVADFIEGRMPQRMGAKHYLALANQSSKFYQVPSLHREAEKSSLNTSLFFRIEDFFIDY